MLRSATTACARLSLRSSLSTTSLSHVIHRQFHAAPALFDRILIVDGIEPVCAQILRDAGHEVDEAAKLPAADLLARIGNYHGLIVRSETKVTVRARHQLAEFERFPQSGLIYALPEAFQPLLLCQFEDSTFRNTRNYDS